MYANQMQISTQKTESEHVFGLYSVCLLHSCFALSAFWFKFFSTKKEKPFNIFQYTFLKLKCLMGPNGKKIIYNCADLTIIYVIQNTS